MHVPVKKYMIYYHSILIVMYNVQGAFVGTFSSLIFTMWMGFGQTVSQLTKHYDGATWSPKKPVSIEGCPESWLNYTTPAAVGPSESFTHLPLYEVSYMWFSAIACIWCIVVGIIVSLLSKPKVYMFKLNVKCQRIMFKVL